MSLLPTQPDCCTPCTVPLVTNIPGTAGEDGIDGEAGAAGKNAFTSTSASFVMPAVDDSETVAVLDSTWGIALQNVFVEFAGHMQVVSRPDPTHLVLKNLGYTGNAAPAVVIPLGSFVSPGGIKGADGAFAGTLNSLSPTTTRGDMLIDDHANNPAASLIRYPVGANGTRSMADSAVPAGQRYAKVDLAAAAEVTGIVPVANGGTGVATIAAAQIALGILTITAVIDFPSLIAGASSGSSVTFTGAVLGDAVFLGLPSNNSTGLVYQAYVSAADTVIVRATNASTGTVDAPSGTFRIVIIRI